jgi:DNA-directed RNA polymerase specialized sigma24 family protein
MSTSDAARLRRSESLSEQLDFDDFYRACREEIVRALVLMVGHRDLGLEAADEAFARALERWADVSGYANPEGWVYRVGANWARSKLRRRTFILDGLFGDSVYIDDLPEPELLTAVEHLPIKYRSVIVARFFLDWSVQQTAEALNLPEGTVKTRQARALSRLRRRLGERNEP